MDAGRILEEEGWTSAVMREAAARVNFLWRVAWVYRAPEPLAFMEALASGIERRKEALEACRGRQVPEAGDGSRASES